jgi:hypothetical protein
VAEGCGNDQSHDESPQTYQALEVHTMYQPLFYFWSVYALPIERYKT